MTAAQSTSDARPSPIAGQWYPDDPAILARTIDHMLEEANPPEIPGRVMGALVPHAGLQFSGPVAAHAFKLLRGLEVKRVAVISPMHYEHTAPVLTTGHEAYRTPLGDVPVDAGALDMLDELISLERVRNDSEHALEIELPFLQRALGDFALVPLMLRDQSLPLMLELGAALAAIMESGDASLIVASSDLSHYYTQDVARILDTAVLDKVAAFDPPGVLEVVEHGLGFACGRGAIATMLIATRKLGANTAQIVKHATSAETSGDYSRVVGYGAAVVYRAA